MHPLITEIDPRLWWDGRHGVARHGGVTVDLRAAPVLGHLHLVELDYAPSVRVAMVRESAQAWREMSREERHLAKALLERVSAAAHAATQPDTPAPETTCQNAP